MSENCQTKKAFERLAKSNDSYNGSELFKSLYKCVEGCREWSKLKDSEEYGIAADRTQVFVSNLDNYDNID
jgi:hypothetical protein